MDQLAEIAEVCRGHGVWLHVDAAYGGFAALTDERPALRRGLDARRLGHARPAQVALPAVRVRLPARAGRLTPALGLRVVPDYLSDAARGRGETNFADLGLQLTRTSRALKVWVSIQAFGLDAFRAAIDRSIELAQCAAERVQQSESLELMRPPSLGIVCFRRRFDGRTTSGLRMNVATPR